MSETSQKLAFFDINKAIADLRRQWEESKEVLRDGILLAQEAQQKADKTWMVDKKLSLAVECLVNVVAIQQTVLSGVAEGLLNLFEAISDGKGTC